jgi:predicted transcriptional regulator of viral defense system
MNDRSDWERLGRVAEAQGGFFTSAQAFEAGISRALLSAQTRVGGRLERAARGLYRFRFVPRSSIDPILAAWVQAGVDNAVVSHESALELYALSDVAPDAVHLTLPRDQRWRKAPTGSCYHWPRTTIATGDTRFVQGVRATTPERTIIDVLETGTQPEQIEQAVEQAVGRALTTTTRLRGAAAFRSQATRAALERVIEAA